MHRIQSTLRVRTVLACSLLFAAAQGCSGGGGDGVGPLTFTYTDVAPTYPACATITPNQPVLASLLPTAFAVTPALPAGMSLDVNTGVISGAPTLPTPATTYRVSATTGLGVATADIEIEVELQVMDFQYGGTNTITGTRGFDLGDLAPTVLSGGPTSFAITAGALPTGLSLDGVTGEISGRPIVSGTLQITIEATDCSAATVSVDVDIQIDEPLTQGVYIANSTDGTLSSYMARDGAEQLRSTGYGIATITECDLLACHPGGAFLYGADRLGDDIQVFALDPSSGRITGAPSTASVGADAIVDLAVDPSGGNLYVATAAGALHQFSIAAATGALTALVPGSVDALQSCASLTIHKAGQYVYASETGAPDQVSLFTRDPGTGALSATAAYASFIPPEELVCSADGLHLYYGSLTDATLRGLDVDQNTGALTPAPWSPVALGVGGLRDLVVTADGQFLYAASASSSEVLIFELDILDGEPVPHTTPSVSLSHPGLQLAVADDHAALYAVTDNGPLNVFEIESDGLLVPAASPLQAVRPGAESIALQPAADFSEFQTGALYTLSNQAGSAELHGYTLSPSGLLSSVSVAQVASVNPCWDVTTHPYDDLVYVSDDNTPVTTGCVQAFTHDGAYVPSYLGDFGTATKVDALRFDPTGRFAYQSLWLTASVQAYTYDENTGALIEGATIAADFNPSTLAIDPTGRFLAVPNDGASNVSLYTIDKTTGALSFVSTTSTAVSGATRAFFHPSGRFLYVVGEGAGVIAIFDVDTATPALAQIGVAGPLGNEAHIAMHPSGRYIVRHDDASGVLQVLAVDLDSTNVTADGLLSVLPGGVASGTFDAHSLTFEAQGAYLILASYDGLLQTRSFDAQTGTLGAAATDTELIPVGLNFVTTRDVIQ